MDFEEALNQLVSEHQELSSLDSIITALELKLYALREEEARGDEGGA